MKREWDLIRKQLTDIEEDRDVLAELPDEPQLANQTWEEYEKHLKEYKTIEGRIFGHLEMLIENRYIEGFKVIRSSDGIFNYNFSNPRLTMAGHDLLDTMRSPKIWGSIKSIAKKKGIELTFDAIKTIGSAVLKQLIV